MMIKEQRIVKFFLSEHRQGHITISEK